MSTPRGRQLYASARQRYPAIRNAIEPIGVRQTIRILIDIAGRCPDTRFLLLGIGEGARPAAVVLKQMRREGKPIPLARIIAVTITTDTNRVAPTASPTPTS